MDSISQRLIVAAHHEIHGPRDSSPTRARQHRTRAAAHAGEPPHYGAQVHDSQINRVLHDAGAWAKHGGFITGDRSPDDAGHATMLICGYEQATTRNQRCSGDPRPSWLTPTRAHPCGEAPVPNTSANTRPDRGWWSSALLPARGTNGVAT
jgi:hypothetical protein